ncbi:hypothetical protein O0I10_006483 [Lichtheimia ornata]|uniref:Uncharacterized protein n=1 Tax=Lichtheimia ornata TaxID=688661 RepID=A0AAD7V340_9FUNG|nr:uncharacterized protein O0I10_006483 [Lichtheimia ornata]KAJ8657955.1 hypothetical protein O0I10_006483 [Lichtheimia ornata]
MIAKYCWMSLDNCLWCIFYTGQPTHVSDEWAVSATSDSMHIIGAISTFIPSSGAFHYLQFGEPPETQVSYRLIMSATRSRFLSLASASFRSFGGSDYRQFL